MKLDIAKENITDNIVFVSGLTRSGKAILSPLISSFEKVEKINVNFFLEQIPQLRHTNQITDEVSTYLLRAGMNLMAFDNAIGRNSNFRVDDFTSVWKYRDPMMYIRRLNLPDKDEVINRINNENMIFSMMAHNALWHADIWFRAYPKLKIIHVSRNPLEIVYSWMQKNYGGAFYKSTRANILTYAYGNDFIPYYAYGWEEEYLACDKTDRIILMVKKIITNHINAFNSLDKKFKDRVFFVKHHQIATDPDKALSKVTKFLNTRYSESTPKILLEERCPRSIDPLENKKKIEIIKNDCSSESFKILMHLVDEFEKNVF